MRNKNVIENLAATSLNKTQYLLADIGNNKPHATAQYVTEQLAEIESRLSSLLNYLELED